MLLTFCFEIDLDREFFRWREFILYENRFLLGDEPSSTVLSSIKGTNRSLFATDLFEPYHLRLLTYLLRI